MSIRRAASSTSASARVPSENVTKISYAPATTCQLVRITPFDSTTKPDPAEVLNSKLSLVSGADTVIGDVSAVGRARAVMLTTLGSSLRINSA